MANCGGARIANEGCLSNKAWCSGHENPITKMTAAASQAWQLKAECSTFLTYLKFPQHSTTFKFDILFFWEAYKTHAAVLQCCMNQSFRRNSRLLSPLLPTTNDWKLESPAPDRFPDCSGYDPKKNLCIRRAAFRSDVAKNGATVICRLHESRWSFQNRKLPNMKNCFVFEERHSF